MLMIKIAQYLAQNFHKTDRIFSWNGCDDELRKRIKNSNFVRDIRKKLAKKSLLTKSRLVQKRQF